MQRIRGKEDSGWHAYKSDHVNQQEQKQAAKDDHQTDRRHVQSHACGSTRHYGYDRWHDHEQRWNDRDDAEHNARHNGKHEFQQEVDGISSLFETDHRQQTAPAIGKIKVLKSHDRHQKIFREHLDHRGRQHEYQDKTTEQKYPDDQSSDVL